MKRLQIYKHASDFAFATLDIKDAFELSQKCDGEFSAAKFDTKDYTYWKQSFSQCRQNFTALANQNAPSVPPIQRPSAPAATA